MFSSPLQGPRFDSLLSYPATVNGTEQSLQSNKKVKKNPKKINILSKIRWGGWARTCIEKSPVGEAEPISLLGASLQG
jgi:hypothetical protein